MKINLDNLNEFQLSLEGAICFLATQKKKKTINENIYLYIHFRNNIVKFINLKN